MANVNRHHIEYDKPRHYLLGPDAIEIGDLCYQSNALGDAYPASSAPWQGSLAATQRWFTQRFIGVAHQRSDATEITVTGEIYIGTAGVYGFPILVAAVAEVGEMYAVEQDPAGNLLYDQVIVATDKKAEAIAVAAYRVGVADVERQVEIFAPVTDLSRKCCFSTTTTTTTTSTSTTTTTTTTTA